MGDMGDRTDLPLNPKSARRRDKLAAALRANLRKRKQAAKKTAPAPRDKP